MTRKSSTQVGTQVGTQAQAQASTLAGTLEEISRMQAKLNQLIAEVSAAVKADVPTQAQAQAPKRTRKASAPKQTSAKKSTPKKAAAPVVEKMTPTSLSLALTGAKVGQRVELAGMSKRDVNKLVSASGGTWNPGAWVDGKNPTYRFNGHTFTFDNTKSWKPGSERGMTRTA